MKSNKPLGGNDITIGLKEGEKNILIRLYEIFIMRLRSLYIRNEIKQT